MINPRWRCNLLSVELVMRLDRRRCRCECKSSYSLCTGRL